MVFILLRLFPLFREANIRDFVQAVPAKVEIHNPPRNTSPLMEQLPLLLIHFPVQSRGGGGLAQLAGAEGTSVRVVGVGRRRAAGRDCEAPLPLRSVEEQSKKKKIIQK